MKINVASASMVGGQVKNNLHAIHGTLQNFRNYQIVVQQLDAP
jgi:hypothetical protein